MPVLLMVGEDSAILPTVFTKGVEGRRLVKHWPTISIAHIEQIGDIDETVQGKHCKRK